MSQIVGDLHVADGGPCYPDPHKARTDCAGGVGMAEVAVKGGTHSKCVMLQTTLDSSLFAVETQLQDSLDTLICGSSRSPVPSSRGRARRYFGQSYANLETNVGLHDMGRAILEAADLNEWLSLPPPFSRQLLARAGSFCMERSGHCTSTFCPTTLDVAIKLCSPAVFGCMLAAGHLKLWDQSKPGI